MSVGNNKIVSVVKVVFLFIAITSFSARAQDVSVSAKSDAGIIRIGEQTKLHLKVDAPADATVKFPLIPDTITKIEILERGKIDTLKSADGKQITYEQAITITAFDSGYYAIPPFVFTYQRAGKQDSVLTEAMLFTVNTVPIDTAEASIKAIKPPMEIPFTFREALPYIIIGLAAIGLIAGLIYYLKKRKKKPVAEKKVFIPTRPAHEIALEDLRKLETQKLWQSGYYKRYHSGVSDIIRTYIEYRYGIKAMEQTSDETLEAFRGNILEPIAKEKLQYILRTADFVKFAKAEPIASENELSITNAYAFIELTKPSVMQATEKKEEVPAS